MAKRILVNGSAGFIGGHLVKRLKAEGYWVEPEDTHWDGEIYREVCAPWCHDSATGWALTVKPIRCGIEAHGERGVDRDGIEIIAISKN